MLIQAILIFMAISTKPTKCIEIKPNVTTLHPTNKTVQQNTATSWKIETSFTPSNLDKSEEKNGEKKEEIEDKSAELKEDKGNSSEFKPSPQLESYVDVGSFEADPTKNSLGPYSPVIKKPPVGFYESPKSKYPKDIFKNYNQFPYKIESPILTRTRDSWKPSAPSSALMEPTPTDEAPVRVPAGGFYKLPDAFKDKPGLSGDDSDFGLEFNGNKENSIKKGRNPWKQLMNFLVASIPIGIIISALTPNVLTIQSTGPDYNRHILRRSGLIPNANGPDLPPISERCRRRLLCELHSDVYYRSSQRRGKQCYRILCEDTEGLSKALSWLLENRQDGDHWHHYT